MNPFATMVTVGWIVYFISGRNSLILLALLGLGTVVVFFQTQIGLRKAAAANNVVAAAATYAALSEADKVKVHEHAIHVIKQSGWRTNLEVDFDNDIVRYGWYALSLNELGIAPIALTRGWNIVRNPFIALSPTDSMIDSAIQHMKSIGFEVTLDRSCSPKGLSSFTSMGDQN